MKMTPCAFPRSGSGNHLEKLREIFGNAPASPTPKRNLATSSEEKFQASPVAIVKADHHNTMRVSTFRGPMTSPSQPLGISNAAYAKVNALNTHPICTALRFNSSRIAGAAEEIATRSRYVMIDSTSVNRRSLKRARVAVGM